MAIIVSQSMLMVNVDLKAYNEAMKLMPDIEKEKSFRIAPNYINVYYNLANLVKLNSNRLEEAIKVIIMIYWLFQISCQIVL